jgi:large subunit ribosomal protein L15
MSYRKPKRVRHRRGGRTSGFGRVGEHRGRGQQDGHGKTGYHKGKWTYTTAHDMSRFGKRGFRYPDEARTHHQSINVGDIVRHLDTFTGGTPASKDTPVAVNLTAHGFHKVLGAGPVPIPLAVTAAVFTRRAAEKIKAAGGSIKGTIQTPREKKPRPPPAERKPKEKAKAKPKKAEKEEEAEAEEEEEESTEEEDSDDAED